MNTLTRQHFMAAGKTDATGRMPLTLLTRQCIDIATEHANLLGIGYAGLQPRGLGWVLGSLSAVIHSLPRLNTDYGLTTWIESNTRLYSNRCMALTDAPGTRLHAAIRTIWVAIDTKTRTAANLDDIVLPTMTATAADLAGLPAGCTPCPAPRVRHIAPAGGVLAGRQYTFGYTDLDFNRHVNSVRYVQHLLNLLPLQMMDTNRPTAFAISFLHECRYGQTVTLQAEQDAAGTVTMHIVQQDGTPAVAARLETVPADND